MESSNPGKDFIKAFKEGKFDGKFNEVILVYNVVDDRYYIYKKGEGEEYYYADTENPFLASQLFVCAREELEEARR